MRSPTFSPDRPGRRVPARAAAARAAATFAGAVVLTACSASSGPSTTRSPSASPSPTPAPVTATAAPGRVPSQTPAQARRDGVVPAVARLSVADRVDVVASVRTRAGVWVASRLPEPSARPQVLGPRRGREGRDRVSRFDYGEVLLLDSTKRRILRAFPLPGLPPAHVLVTADAVFCERQGDGALPDSMLCRIDRSTYHWSVRVFPSAMDSAYRPRRSSVHLPPNWSVAPPAGTRFESLRYAGPDLLVGGYDGVATVDAAKPPRPCRAAALHGRRHHRAGRPGGVSSNR